MSEKIIGPNESAIKNELKELGRYGVEETLNGLLEQGEQALTNAAKIENHQANCAFCRFQLYLNCISSMSRNLEGGL